MPTVDEHGVTMLVRECEPVPEATEHARLVDMLYAGLNARFADRDDVTVHERLAWFPDASDTRIRLDPDVMVVIGRPKARRRSYKAWAEEDVPPTIILEVASPEDTSTDYDRRLRRASDHGVTEAVLIDPFAPGGVLVSYLRTDGDGRFRTVAVSSDLDHPVVIHTLGITMAGGAELTVTDPHGTWVDTTQQIVLARQHGTRAQQEAARSSRLAQALRDAGIDPDTI